MKNFLLVTAVSMTAAAVTCGATLIHEAVTGHNQRGNSGVRQRQAGDE